MCIAGRSLKGLFVALLLLCITSAAIAENVKELKKRAEKGDALAENNLGVAYHSGTGVPRDDSEAVRWYRMAAEQGLAAAQLNLGVMYHTGEGTAQDEAEAVRWFRKAAEQGDTEAEFNVGLMYYGGNGVTKDLAEAILWFRKAAEHGIAQAQYNLALMYYNGEGTAPNKGESVRWLRKAAEQGFPPAQHSVAQMYANGEMVEKDLALAAYWYDKAAQQGDDDASKELNSLKKMGVLPHPPASERAPATPTSSPSPAVANVSHPAEYPLTVKVSSISKEQGDTKVIHKSKPSYCSNPQGGFQRGFCSTYNPSDRVTTDHDFAFTSELDGKLFELASPILLDLGDYPARFDPKHPHEIVEILVSNPNGKVKKVALRVQGIHEKT